MELQDNPSSTSTTAAASNNDNNNTNVPIVQVEVQRTGTRCPFGNTGTIQLDVYRGGCVWIQGSSGRGKSTIAMSMAGLATIPTNLDIAVQVQWDPTILETERCGVVFQQTTLLDELTVAGNLAIALDRQPIQHSFGSYRNDDTSTKTTIMSREQQIKYLLELVGLDYNRDANKRISQLSGGMSRRASLAVQLAQYKHVIVLDEPFTGLDHDTAISIANELVHLRRTLGTAFVLITHQHDIASVVMDNTRTNNNTVVQLEPPPSQSLLDQLSTNGISISDSTKPNKLKLFGTTFVHRLIDHLMDYIGWSLPLIILTFLATGLAIAMLSADSLNRIDVKKYVMEIVEKEIPPMIKMLTGEEPGMLTMLGVRVKVNSMLQSTIPPAKASLYSIGYTKLMVLEVGPLLTGLLLTGRIGGSYAGKLATMYATQQMLLLQTIGITPTEWTFLPSIVAAMIASPILTIIGTTVALTVGGFIAPRYNIGTIVSYQQTVYETIFPPLRLQSSNTMSFQYWYDTIIEIGTWPPVFHLLKSLAFIVVTMIIAEIGCYVQRTFQQYRHGGNKLTIKDVPTVITSSVVTSGLAIICIDWAFSQFWLLRK